MLLASHTSLDYIISIFIAIPTGLSERLPAEALRRRGVLLSPLSECASRPLLAGSPCQAAFFLWD